MPFLADAIITTIAIGLVPLLLSPGAVAQTERQGLLSNNANGRVLVNPVVTPILIGSMTQSHVDIAAYLDRFYKAIVDGPFFEVMRQYGVNTGSVNPIIRYRYSRKTLSEAELQAIISSVMAQKSIDPMNDNYFPVHFMEEDLVYRPSPGIAQNGVSGSSCAKTRSWEGYHLWFTEPRSQTLQAYGIIPHCSSSPIEKITDTASHELAEAITDPHGDAWRSETGGEVGDICENGDLTTTYTGYNDDTVYYVQRVWSNSENACVERPYPETMTVMPLAGHGEYSFVIAPPARRQSSPSSSAGWPRRKSTTGSSSFVSKFVSKGATATTSQLRVRMNPDGSFTLGTATGDRCHGLGIRSLSDIQAGRKIRPVPCTTNGEAWTLLMMPRGYHLLQYAVAGRQTRMCLAVADDGISALLKSCNGQDETQYFFIG